VTSEPIPQSGADFRRSGSKIGVLVIHGFTGNVESIRPWAEGFHEAGFTVLAPTLPGHGTTVEDLNTKNWMDWYKKVEDSFLELQKSCDRIFVAGFSAGGALALRLAQIRGGEFEGVLLCNAAIFDDRKILKALPLLKRIIPTTRTGLMDVKKQIQKRTSYDRLPLKALDSLRKLWKITEENLYMVDLPLFVGYSVDDHVVHPINSETIIDNVSSSAIREVIFEDSYHNVSWDNDANVLIEESVRYIQEVLSGEFGNSDEFDERELIDAEFESIVSGLKLDTSADTTYLDTLDALASSERDSYFIAPRPRYLNLSQASRFSLAAILASAAYIIFEGFNGGDPLGLGGWPAVILFTTGVATFIWRTSKKRRDDGGDGYDGYDDGAIL
jgi:carboxylesterase